MPLGGDWAYTVREPLGVCAGIGAWNYPTQIACWKARRRWPAATPWSSNRRRLTPLCALKVAEILMEAGAPPGLFNVIQGAGAVGAALVTGPARRQGLADRLGAHGPQGLCRGGRGA
jgi:betaine-aldehyde dehydrogenase